MTVKANRGFWIILSSGDKFQVSELDYNHLKGRIATGRTQGWYMQRGETVGDRHDWNIQFKDLAGFWADGAAPKKDELIREIDLEKRLPSEVGKKEEKVDNNCKHNWNDATTWEHVVQNAGGINRYYKRCLECGAKSQLVKKREVELTYEKMGKDLTDVPVID